jgi:hypothetical protein
MSPTLWERIVGAQSSRCDSSEVGCSYKTIVRTQCQTEINRDGKPVRRCEKIQQRFLLCPGLPMEEIERSLESSTDTLSPREAEEERQKGLLDTEKPFRWVVIVRHCWRGASFSRAKIFLLGFLSFNRAGGENQVLGESLGQFFEEFKRLADELQAEAFQGRGPSKWQAVLKRS